MRKNFKICLYWFLLFHPILDILATYVKIGSISLSTILRPCIPAILLLILFFQDRKLRKILLCLTPIYLLYTCFHLVLFSQLRTTFAFGTVIHEAQYLINYGYFLFTFLLYLTIFKEDVKWLQQGLAWMIVEILFLLIVSTITGTNTTTYLEGIGNKGWFSTGGMLGSTLVLSLFILIPYILKKKKRKWLWGIVVCTVIFYLFFFLGTRVGMYGSLLVLLMCIYACLFLYFVQKRKAYIRFFFLNLLVIGIGFALLGWRTERNRYLDDLKDDIKDPDTGEVIHIAYDILKVKKDIDRGEASYLNSHQTKAISKLYQYAYQNNLDSVDLRMQQLLYHTYLYESEGWNFPLKLFGNGYLRNMGALTLEMEVIALWYNFGIIGFILFLGFFIFITGYGIYIGISHIDKIDFEYMMLTFGCLFSFVISLLSGHTFFHPSVMIVIIVLFVCYYHKIKRIEDEAD